MLRLSCVSALLLGACVSADLFANETTPEPTTSPTASPTASPEPTCDYIKLVGNATDTPLHRAPGTCWNDRETHKSDKFRCDDETGELVYELYDGVNCFEQKLNSNSTVDVDFAPDSDLNAGRMIESFDCGLSDCWVEVTYFNVSGQACPITYQMDRRSYTLGSCSFNVEVEENTLWECCDGGGVRLSFFESDDMTCSGDAQSQVTWDAELEDGTGGAVCADFEQANPDGDSDIEWRCNGQTVDCGGGGSDEEEKEKVTTTQILLIVLFTVVAFAGCIYCVYTGRNITTMQKEDQLLEDAGNQANYQSSGVAA